MCIRDSIILLYRHRSLVRFTLSIINRIRSRSRSRVRRFPACLPTLSSHMTGMTTPSTLIREACADAYRCGTQNLYFGLPKLLQHQKVQNSVSLKLRNFFFRSSFFCILSTNPFLQCAFRAMHGQVSRSLDESNKLILNIELSSLRAVSW